MVKLNLMSVFGVTVDGRYVVAYYDIDSKVSKVTAPNIKLVVTELPFDEIANLGKIYTKYGCIEYHIGDGGMRSREMRALLQMYRSDLQVVVPSGAYRIIAIEEASSSGVYDIKFLGVDASIKDIESKDFVNEEDVSSEYDTKGYSAIVGVSVFAKRFGEKSIR